VLLEIITNTQRNFDEDSVMICRNVSSTRPFTRLTIVTSRHDHTSSFNGVGPKEDTPHSTGNCDPPQNKARSAQVLSRLRFFKYDPYYGRHFSIMNKWVEASPPPLSEYRLTFGKHEGKRLDEVPTTYLLKYLRHPGMTYRCPIVVEAVEDFMQRHPDVISQAGPKKTKPKPIKGGIEEVPDMEKTGRESAVKPEE
jgi:hypothetical protein